MGQSEQSCYPECSDYIQYGFYSQFFIYNTLPHTDPKCSYYKVETPWYTVTYTGHPDYGLPYGAIPRLLIAYIATYIRSNDYGATVLFSRSLSDFMHRIGLQCTGGKHGTLTRFKKQMKALFTMTIHLEPKQNANGGTQSKFKSINSAFARYTDLWWNDNPTHNFIILAPDIYEDFKRHSFPFSLDAITALKRSPFALDVYFWLIFRIAHINKPTSIKVYALMNQIGGFAITRHGKYRFLENLRKALIKIKPFYPQAEVKIDTHFIHLWPSPTQIPQKLDTDNTLN